ncbi:MAG: insulinase family protein [Henriciella sp.]|nr:insulinase family protein [Henriciella sp.]
MRSSILFSGAALALALSACTDANQNGTDNGNGASAPGFDVEVHDGEFATIQQFTTPGGVSVWLVEEPSIPILSLRMAWTAGETNDPEGLEGLTNAMVYHMNEGAGELDAQGFFKGMEELNMSFSCGASNESTYCNASMLTDNADASFDMIALAFAEPRFDDGPFERFKREQEVSLQTRETNPQFLAARARAAALYPDSAYARETDAESLAALTQDAMRAQKDLLMVQEGMLVTAVGAMSPEELAPLIDKAVSGLPESSETAETDDVVLAAPASAPVVIDLPQPQSLVTFAAPAMTREDPDFYTAVVLNYTFGGGGFESRLMKDLRVAKGLTYGIYTQVSSADKIQLWSGGGQTKNESAGEFIEGIKENMSAMVAEGMTEEELSAAKAYLTGSYPLGFDSNAKIAARMMGVRLDELPVDFFDKRNAMVEAVTLEDVNRVAAEYLSPENFTFIVVGQPEGLDG